VSGQRSRLSRLQKSLGLKLLTNPRKPPLDREPVISKSGLLNRRGRLCMLRSDFDGGYSQGRCAARYAGSYVKAESLKSEWSS
jgi:hypothetical protein